MCGRFLGGRNIVADYSRYPGSWQSAIDENGGYFASVYFLTGPAYFTGHARRGRNDNPIDSMLEKRSGMIQLILDTFIGIADNYLIAIPHYGGFDCPHDPGEE